MITLVGVGGSGNKSGGDDGLDVPDKSGGGIKGLVSS